MKRVAIISVLITFCSQTYSVCIDDFRPAPNSIRDQLVGDWKTETSSITGKQGRVFQFAILRYRENGLLESYCAEDATGGALRFTNAVVMVMKADLTPGTNAFFHGDEVMCGPTFFGPVSLSSAGFSQTMSPFGSMPFRRIGTNEYEALKIRAMRIMAMKLREIWRGEAPEDIANAYIDADRLTQGKEHEEREPAAGGYGREDAAKPQR